MAVHSGPIVIGYDGTPAAERAVREAAELLAPRSALVVVVWKPGLAFELMELPTATVGLPPAPIDLRTAMEIDQAEQERAQRLAEQGAHLAREAGLDAEGVAVAEDLEITIAETLTRVAKERDAQAIAIGAHPHSGIGELIAGSTLRGVLKHAPCPVLVARADER